MGDQGSRLTTKLSRMPTPSKPTKLGVIFSGKLPRSGAAVTRAGADQLPDRVVVDHHGVTGLVDGRTRGQQLAGPAVQAPFVSQWKPGQRPGLVAQAQPDLTDGGEVAQRRARCTSGRSRHRCQRRDERPAFHRHGILRRRLLEGQQRGRVCASSRVEPLGDGHPLAKVSRFQRRRQRIRVEETADAGELQVWLPSGVIHACSCCRGTRPRNRRSWCGGCPL